MGGEPPRPPPPLVAPCWRGGCSQPLCYHGGYPTGRGGGGAGRDWRGGASARRPARHPEEQPPDTGAPRLDHSVATARTLSIAPHRGAPPSPPWAAVGAKTERFGRGSPLPRPPNLSAIAALATTIARVGQPLSQPVLSVSTPAAPRRCAPAGAPAAGRGGGCFVTAADPPSASSVPSFFGGKTQRKKKSTVWRARPSLLRAQPRSRGDAGGACCCRWPGGGSGRRWRGFLGSAARRGSRRGWARGGRAGAPLRGGGDGGEKGGR